MLLLKYLNKFNNFALIICEGTNPKSLSSEKNTILRYYGIGAQIIKELKNKKYDISIKIKETNYCFRRL